MVTTWCTDPSQGNFQEDSGQFSSYYQYDTVSQKLVRIRLELNRTPYIDPETQQVLDAGDTQVILNEDRAVGFTSQDMVSDTTHYPDEVFSMYYDQVLVLGSALSSTPNDGDWVIDMSSGDVTPHFGNKVTVAPNLPEGIETKHLSLLANQAIIDGHGSVLTNGAATAQELSAALKAGVCDIINAGAATPKTFDQITDEDILSKLKEQVTKIREQSTQASEVSINDSMEDVDVLVEQINDAIENGTLTPDKTLEDAFDAYTRALANVDDAMDTGTMTAEIKDLQAAHDTLVTAFEQSAAQQMDTYQENLDNASQAIESARQASQRMDAITEEYESTEQAESIQAYEDSMKGVDTTAAAEEM